MPMSAASASKNLPPPEDLCLKEREIVLRAAKEIVVKFIEMGRVTPASFPEVFKRVYDTIAREMNGHPPNPESLP